MLIATPARADRTDFRVNDDNALVEHSHPRIAVAEGVGLAIAWSDFRNGQSDIFIQRYSIAGEPIGANRQVNDDTGLAHQSGPALGVDPSGTYSLIWQDYRDGAYPFDPAVYLQRFDTALESVGMNLKLTTERPDTLKGNPDLALGPDGAGVIVWADYRNRNWDIYGQLIASNGALIGANFRVNDDAGTFQQHAPRVSVSAEGWFVVSWYDNRFGNDDIFAQRFDTSGQRLGVNIRVNSDNSGTRQAFPDVAADGSGHFTVVWVDWRNGIYPANPDIYERRFDRSGQPLIADKKVNTDGTARAQREPTIAADRMGNVAIIWSDSTGSSWDIVGQMVDVDGVVREANFRANLSGDSAQLQPDAALDGRYRYVTWADRRNGRYDIYASITKYNDPSIMATPTTLNFTMDIGDPAISLPLVIEHIGYNPLSYRIASSDNWLTTSPSTGTTPDTVMVTVAPGQTCGTHFGTLMLVDILRQDSSTVIPVRLDVTAPILSIAPDTVRLNGTAHLADTVFHTMTVRNAGSGHLTWSAHADSSWLWLSRLSGSEGDAVIVGGLTETLDTGMHVAQLVIASPEASNTPETLIVLLSTLPLGADTVSLGSGQCQIQSPFELPVTLTASSPITTLRLPISFDSSWVQIDSARSAAGLPAGIAFSSVLDSATQLAVLTVTGGEFNTLPIGTTQIATVFGTARNREGITYLEAGYVDTLMPLAKHTNGIRSAVAVSAGEITIGNPTDAPESPGEVPRQLALSQNYPNPFNAGTVVEFELPTAGQVKLEIFNVLGQQVAVPVDGRYLAGRHRTEWDAVLKSGRPAPSGIYFYRLRTSTGTLVRKMVLVK